MESILMIVLELELHKILITYKQENKILLFNLIFFKHNLVNLNFRML